MPTSERTHLIVYCLSVDMVGSTKTSLKMASDHIDKFNNALMDQIRPHLMKLGLEGELLKFTGDGWLLMTANTDMLRQLCCLAIIMSHKFQQEMSRLAGMEAKNVPPLKIAICSGKDIQVDLPNGKKDWAGDSARRATRLCACCKNGEILVNEPVKSEVYRDFNFSKVDVKTRQTDCCQPPRMEEDFTVYALRGIKDNVAAELKGPECFVYTLGILGQKAKAREVAEVLEHRAERLSKQQPVKKSDVEKATALWNKLINSQVEYKDMVDYLQKMKSENLDLNLETFKILINQAPDYKIAEKWLLTLEESGLQPDIEVYSYLAFKAKEFSDLLKLKKRMLRTQVRPMDYLYRKLIRKAPDEQTAIVLFSEMKELGIGASLKTYEAILDRTNDFEGIRRLWRRMRKSRVSPEITTFNIVISKAPDYETAMNIFALISKEGLTPNRLTYKKLAQKAPNTEIKKSWLKRLKEMEV